MPNLFYHKEITDTQWNKIKFLFPQKKVGRKPLAPRTVFNAILWMLASGARWRDLPTRYGNWNSIYHKFRQSTFCKVHQSARCALKNQTIGMSRGGKNTKVHIIINEKMQLLNVILTGGNIHDSQPAIKLFDNVEIEGKKALADKAYS